MTQFAFVTWDGGGNVPPAVGIAHRLVARGHGAVFFGYEVQRSRLESAGFGFIALPRSGGFDIYREGDPAARIAGLMQHVWACPQHLEDIPEAAAAAGADVVIVDFSMSGAMAAVERLQTPAAVLAHSTVEGLVPPPQSPVGAARLNATNAVREAIGLPGIARLNDAWAGLPTLVTTIPDLDPAALDAASNVHYVGPIFESRPDAPWQPPWDRDDERPLIVVSFTTTGLWDQTARILNTLDGLAAEPVRVIASAPNGIAASRIPANAEVRAFVPHRSVLPLAAATVTHGGHGTVSASLAYGVPIVAIPNQAADQPFLATTIQRLGAGIALEGTADADDIRKAVKRLLAEPEHAAVARRLGDVISTMPGPEGAADLLETWAAGTTRRPH